MNHVSHVGPSKTILRLIDTNIPIFSPHVTIAVVKKTLLTESKTFDSVNYIYVVNHLKKLVGILSIKEILSLPEESILEKVMRTEIFSVHPYAHQEKAAHVALKHNIKAVPVIDKDELFLGVVPFDRILQITNDEITEDLLLLEGIYSKEFAAISTLDNPPLQLLRRRLPWLIIGLLGGLLAAHIIGIFEELLRHEILLISFLPLMVYMSDAVGSQSQTIFIRHLAINGNSQSLRYFLKENLLGLFIALSLSLILTATASFLYNPTLGIIVGLSLLFTIMVSVSIAVLVPWGLTTFHKDPAVASGPFATILRDILSIIFYFSIANVIMNLV